MCLDQLTHPEGLSMAEGCRLAAVRYPLPKVLLIHLSLQSALGQDGGAGHRHRCPAGTPFPAVPEDFLTPPSG